LKWIIKLPKYIRITCKSFVLATIIDGRLKKFKVQFIVDSLIHILLIAHLRNTLKNYKTVLVDWDHHNFGSLLIVAANLNNIKTFTFIYKVIITHYISKPLIAKQGI